MLGDTSRFVSTLLRVLAGRHCGGVCSGEILVNGLSLVTDIKRKIGYVPLDDIHISTQTVKEAVMFSGLMRRSTNVPTSIRKLHVDLVLRLLGLDHVADTRIGDESTRGISGGERRRVSIAIAAVAGQSCTVLDMPTNGLDSITAMNLVRNTRLLTQAGSSFIMSLQQPSIELLSQFDHICIMGGSTCVYWGPLSKALPYFEALGYTKPGYKDTADFLVQIVQDVRFVRQPFEVAQTLMTDEN